MTTDRAADPDGARPLIVRAGTGLDVGLGELLLGGGDSAGQLAIMEMRARPGVVVPDHIHKGAEELFYILEGELIVGMAGTEERVGPGDLVVVPRGTVHAHRNDATNPTRWLTLFAPAGTEGYFAERAHLAGMAPEDAATDYAGLEPKVHAELRERFGIEIIERPRS